MLIPSTNALRGLTGRAASGCAAPAAGGIDEPRPVIGVLALQGDVPEHLRALEAAGARPAPVRRPEELDRVDGLVIPGGESTTLWRLSVAFDVLEPLRKLIGEGLPAFGSCAGMIMLADRLADGVPGQQTYGGIDMTVRRNAFGRQVDSFERDITLGWRRRWHRRNRRPVPRRLHPGALGGADRPGRQPFWEPSRAPVGSSPSGKGNCLPRPSTPS